MFSPFKPFKSLFGTDEVTQILQRIGVPGTSDSFAQRITQSQRQNDLLSLTVDLPADLQGHIAYLEGFLTDQLRSAGISQVRLHAIHSAGMATSGQQSQMADNTISGQPHVSSQSQYVSHDTDALVTQDVGYQTAAQQPHTQLPSVEDAARAADRIPDQHSQAQGSQYQGSEYQGSQSQSGQYRSSQYQSSQGQAQYQGSQGQWQSMSMPVLTVPDTPTTSAVPAAAATPVSSQSADQAPAASRVPPRQQDIKAHPRIRHVIVVASGKGGVGKSTTAVNLALALKAAGARVGLLDADIYGPSIPTMLGLEGQVPEIDNEQFVPLEAHGLVTLSIGNLLGAEQTPVAWRGPKATGALLQLFNQTLWPQLDYLVIDMPPGTGDIQLTLAQRIPVTGAVIVTTPQHVALMDAQKGIELFNKVDIPVLGIVENMSGHVCSHCGQVDEIFGQGGGDSMAARYQVPLLGRLPLDQRIREHADQGQPVMLMPDSQVTSLYQQIALRVIEQVARLPQHAHRQPDQKRIF